ncbi:hypothetical protein [Nocardia gipuzkoensis]|uniref:hypothetical protein n=1 Tax=Nocardia gipuzkoensis TaxID=2749991 RepID=UPI00237D5B43|nr:hypothetical protein [Nocardia gipuzkoensis]MDE1672668.1 hypothetical protein [Nocardia gipuzkoensis]
MMSGDPLRAHVENRYHGELPPEWTPRQREDYLAAQTMEMRQQISSTTEMLFRHNVTQFGVHNHRPPSEEEKDRLRNSSREQAIEIALHALYEGYVESDETEPTPTPAEREEAVGASMDAQWMALPPMQRWATPWAEEPDEDLIGLARRLWKGHDIDTKMAAAHLLQARRLTDLPLPTSVEDPLYQQIHQELLDGLRHEEARRNRLYSSHNPTS